MKTIKNVWVVNVYHEDEYEGLVIIYMINLIQHNISCERLS